MLAITTADRTTSLSPRVLDYGTLGTLLLKLGWDESVERDISGLGCGLYVDQQETGTF